ncbi:MAG: AAA family ATPase, partial [Sandaracinaceae bacterium]|nr:AAA family ATPase [Sandaracinaceae bacterium]
MKILAIRGANLASLDGEFELPLADGPLGEAGVFAICGPTGAGKSTLLDAMCLALFDTAPRLEGAGRVRVGRDPDDRITTADPRSILRQGAGAGWAEVDFRGADERRYRARWEVRRARGRADGKLQPVVMRLEALDVSERWEGRKTDVLAEIEHRLGLSFAQFRRAVLLAQGDFAAFLESDARDRADLLERMTGTAIYGAISVEAHARAGRERAQLELLEARRGAVELLDPEARAGLVERCEALAIRVRQDELAQRDAERALEWHIAREGLLREELEAAGEGERLDRQLALWETRRRELEAYEAVRPLAPRWDARERAASVERARAREHEAACAQATETGALARAARDAHAEAGGRAAEAEARAERERAQIERARALDEQVGALAAASAERRAACAEARLRYDARVAAEAALVARATERAAEAAALARWLEHDPAASLTRDAARTADRLERLVAAHAERAALERERAAAGARLTRASHEDARVEGRLLGFERTRIEREAAWSAAHAAALAAPSDALGAPRDA